MSVNLIEYLRSKYPLAALGWQGYSTAELQKIEKLYDIKITGELHSWLSQMGRNSNGVFGDEALIVYRNLGVRSHVMYQAGIFGLLQGAQVWELLNCKPFVFSCEDETVFFFLLTSSDNPDVVYKFNEDLNSVEKTTNTLFGYLHHIESQYTTPNPACVGELIVI